MNDIIREFSELVHTYGRLFRCSVCFHDYSGEIFKAADISLHMHMNPFCQLVKARKSCEKMCIEFDSRNIRHFFSCGKKGLVKKCHAGVIEFAVPVFSENKLCGAVFIGPFRPVKNSELPGMITQAPSVDLPSETNMVFKGLPEISPSSVDDMLNMARLLADKLGRTITAFNRDYILRQGYREKISYFINREFKNGISVANLAEFLSLSVSRTSRLVKIHTRKTFPELLSERRIEHALFLLENSFFNMDMISKQCGFSEPSYFYRTFRKIRKATPADYRGSLKKKGNSSSSA